MKNQVSGIYRTNEGVTELKISLPYLKTSAADPRISPSELWISSAEHNSAPPKVQISERGLKITSPDL